MGKLKKPTFSKKNSGNKSRKQIRKEKRLSKKERKNEHYKKKFLISNSNVQKTTDANVGKLGSNAEKSKKRSGKKKPLLQTDNSSPATLDSQELQKLNHTNEIKMKRKIENEMKSQRKMQLLEDNKYEDIEIKKLEKQLKMNKRKSKTLPKLFAEEGLDYLLNVCEVDNVKTMLDNQDSGSEFEDDLAIVSGKKKKRKVNKVLPDDSKVSNDDYSDSVENITDYDSVDDDDVDDDDDDVDDDDDDDLKNNRNKTKTKKTIPAKFPSDDVDFLSAGDDSDCDFSDERNSDAEADSDDEDGSDDGADSDDQNMDVDKEGNVDEDGQQTKKSGNYWQDIYGRQRDEKGNIVQSEGKYIPPHLKAKLLGDSSQRKEHLARLSRQLKGLLNRLAENNMHKIVSEIDQLYMQNSRNDMNETLTKLIFESLIQPVLIPERLVSEHTMLIAALHANVGTEVGAYFLQEVVEKFDQSLKKGLDESRKDMENILLVISYLYIFKVCHSVLIFDILNKICSRDSLGEKEVELLLIVLRSAGFGLRKDDPLALKNLIMKIQSQATNNAHQSRVKFMLDVLIAIKNNNMTKVPQYDANRYEQLKKILKNVVQKGKYISELKISLEDLLNASDRGRWWIVGSAWAGDAKDASGDAKLPNLNPDGMFSSKLLDLARKQRMNTDARRNLFCILMSAQDYQDAFEKILKLGLKGQQEQDIVHVIMHCSLQEKRYNPFYSYVAAQFCSNNRKFVMMFQYHLWDRLKELKDLKGFQITNMAKFLAHLFLQNLLPLSALKVIEFASLEKPVVRLLRQLFMAMLLSDNEEDVATVFARISQSSKLHIFRESIRLFFHHFLLKNINEESHEINIQLKKRIQLAESSLMGVNIGSYSNSKM